LEKHILLATAEENRIAIHCTHVISGWENYLAHQIFQIPPQVIGCLEGGSYASKPGSLKK